MDTCVCPGSMTAKVYLFKLKEAEFVVYSNIYIISKMTFDPTIVRADWSEPQKKPPEPCGERLWRKLCRSSVSDSFQSGFRPCHSSEAAVIKVTNDMWVSKDTGKVSAQAFSSQTCHCLPTST